MDAKQTLSASLVGLLWVASPALGDDAEQSPGEVQPKTTTLKMREATGTFEIGAGYTTDDGFMARARVAQSRLFGTDKGLALSAALDERRQEMLLRYDDPTLFDTDLRLRTDLWRRDAKYTGFRREGVGGELSLAKQIAPNLDAFVGYKLEHVTIVGGETDAAARATTEIPGRGDFVIGAIRAGLQYSSIVDPHDPRRGTLIGGSLEYADEQLGGDVHYLRADAWLAHHQPVGPFTLHLGGRASAITDDVPISERLHFDGNADVRGYAPGSILARGGNLMWTGRVELETPAWQGLSLAGFVDAGGLYGGGEGGEVASAGFGIIWRSPIGPLRFDWAKPLTGDDRDLRFLLGIGGSF